MIINVKIYDKHNTSNRVNMRVTNEHESQVLQRAYADNQIEPSTSNSGVSIQKCAQLLLVLGVVPIGFHDQRNLGT